MSILETLSKSKAIVCCGSGGVGKTTLSAALGLAIASQYPLRTLVLTIDPARRLQTAFGNSLKVGNEPTKVSTRVIEKAGVEMRGELWLSMLDQTSMWNRLVERLSPNQQTADRILNSPFYRGISEAFVGSGDYMAIEALVEYTGSGEFDCVIVDTPPSRNALDFLEAPNRLLDFVGARVLSWLAKPYRYGFRVFNIATAPFLNVADRLLGTAMLEELARFVSDLQELYPGAQGRARQALKLMRSSDCSFLVVTTLEAAPFAEASYFCKELAKRKMHLQALVINRALPEAAENDAFAHNLEAVEEDESELASLAERAHLSTEELTRINDAYLGIWNLSRQQLRQSKALSSFSGVPQVKIPWLEQDVQGIVGLAGLSKYI